MTGLASNIPLIKYVIWEFTTNSPSGECNKTRRQVCLISSHEIYCRDVSNITLTISSPELYTSSNTFKLAKLAKDSTFGNDFKLNVRNDKDSQKVTCTFGSKMLDCNAYVGMNILEISIDARKRLKILLDMNKFHQ